VFTGRVYRALVEMW